MRTSPTDHVSVIINESGIEPGDIVRSFDFPDDSRELSGDRACFIEGKVLDIVRWQGCDRYRIEVSRKIVGGEIVRVNEDFAEVLPPLNGTPKFRGVCDGVEKIDPADGECPWLLPGAKVRIIGDTFKHVYTIVGHTTRVERDGHHRLIGGETKYTLRTWSGRERTATCLVPARTLWSHEDRQMASCRVSNRAATARARKINRQVALKAKAERQTGGLSATVKVLRSTRPGPRESRARVIARNKGISYVWLMALVDSGVEV